MPETTSNLREQAEQELLALHRHDRQAHFALDAAALAASQTEPFLAVANGTIERVSQAATRQNFERYFQQATYFEWDDLEPPIVQVSQDGSLGWMITRIKVRRTQFDETGQARESEFIYAGIMTYERQNSTWVRTANVSTFANLKT